MRRCCRRSFRPRPRAARSISARALAPLPSASRRARPIFRSSASNAIPVSSNAAERRWRFRRIPFRDAGAAGRSGCHGGCHPRSPRPAESADWVLMNPPFDPEGRGSHSTDAAPSRRACGARRSAESLVRHGGGRSLKPGGTLGLIHRADALAEVLDALAGKFGGVRDPARSSDRIRGGNPHSRHGSTWQPRTARSSARPCPAPAGGRLDAARGRDPARTGGTRDSRPPLTGTGLIPGGAAFSRR